MKKIILTALALVVAGASLSTAEAAKKDKKQKEAARPTVQLLTGSDSVSYAAGYALADIVRSRFLGGLATELRDTPDTLQLLLSYQGLFDALMGDTTHFSAQPAEKFLNARVIANRKAKEERQQAAGKEFLRNNATQEGVVVLPSGLQYKVLQQGDGPVAKPTDKVRVKYEGRLIDGTVFDSTDKHGGQPATFAPNQVIKGWTEALTMMPVGSKWQLYIPQELAYGSRATGSIPAYSTLVFDVEVLGIDEPQNDK